MKRLAVAYATDDNYVKIAAVSMASLLRSHERGTVTIYCLSSGLTGASVELLEKVASRYGVGVRFIDVERCLKEVEANGGNKYFSYAAYARFYIAELIKDESRVVYLDCDTLIVDSLYELMTMDMGGKPFALAYDCLRTEYKRMIGLEPTQPYYNSGVMVIDVDKWRECRCLERIMDHMKKPHKKYLFPDQEYLALVLGDEAQILSPRYNFLPHYMLFPSRKSVLRVMGIHPAAWWKQEEFDRDIKKPAIYHFLGNTLGRPWYRESRSPMRKVYCEMAAEIGLETLTKSSRPLDIGYKVQALLWKLLPQPLFDLSCKAMYRYFFWSRYNV